MAALAMVSVVEATAAEPSADSASTVKLWGPSARLVMSKLQVSHGAR